MANKEYIIEYRKVGGSVKVSAIDPITLTEVSVIASPSLSQKEMSSLAISKLKYMLMKKGAE